MRFVLLTLMFCVQPCIAVAHTAIDIFIRDDVYEDYQKFLAGRDVQKIADFNSPYMRRDVADMVLLQQALVLGGFTHKFNYLPGKVNFRNTRMLETGELLLSFDTYWLSDAKVMADKVWISPAVIAKGEYLAGIYTSPNNHKVLALNSLADFQQLSAVSTPKWRTDWKTLSALPLKTLVREDEWLSQARMVHMQWADFMLMPFVKSADGHYRLEQIELKVVPKIAILLDDSRHFVVSKKHPDGKAAFTALSKGLEILAKRGGIQHMYQQAGFLVDRSQYQILNKSNTAASSRE